MIFRSFQRIFNQIGFYMFGRKKEKEVRVLLVEDDALLAKVLAQRLAREHFSVKVVGNGLEVMATASTFLPTVILLDLILPGMDGFAVLKQLKANPMTKEIPVVVISNLSEVSDVKSAKVLGAVEYFIKANTQLETIVAFVKKIL